MSKPKPHPRAERGRMAVEFWQSLPPAAKSSTAAGFIYSCISTGQPTTWRMKEWAIGELRALGWEDRGPTWTA